jgi:hypothetical protein
VLNTVDLHRKFPPQFEKLALAAATLENLLADESESLDEITVVLLPIIDHRPGAAAGPDDISVIRHGFGIELVKSASWTDKEPQTPPIVTGKLGRRGIVLGPGGHARQLKQRLGREGMTAKATYWLHGMEMA